MRCLSILCALLLGACTTSYKVAPSTVRIDAQANVVNTRVSVAQEAAKVARSRSLAAESKTKSTQVSVKSVGAHIDAAIVDVEARDYTSAAQHLIAAKVGNAVVAVYLEQTLADLVATGASLATVELELFAAKKDIVVLKGEVGTLQKQVDRQATDCADDQVIAKRCKSWWGLGAIFYGIERLLKAGIVGILILVVVVVVMVAVGGPLGALVIRAFGWWKKK